MGSSSDFVDVSKRSFNQLGSYNYKQLGSNSLDVLTLGQTAVQRRQEKALQNQTNQIRDMQNKQMEELRNIGPTPSKEDMAEREVKMRNRTRRLRRKRTGMAETIKAGESSGKEKLGE